MALGVGQVSKGTTTNAALVTTAAVDTAASGSLIVLAAHWRSSRAFVSIEDNKANSYVQVGTTISNGFSFGRVYYCQNAVGGTGHTATLNISGATEIVLLFMEITGASLNGALDQVAQTTSDTSSPFTSGLTPATTFADEMLVGFLCGGGTINPSTQTISGATPSTGWTIQVKEENGAALWPAGLATAVVSATGQYEAGFEESSATSASVMTFTIAAPGSAFAIGAPTLAAIGHATMVGDVDSMRRYWRVPSTAAQGTAGRMVVFADGSLPNTVVYEGTVVADAVGNFDLGTGDASAIGTKRFAVVHAWNGVTGTTSIYGGTGISELIDLG